jgi:hypothetical protein
VFKISDCPVIVAVKLIGNTSSGIVVYIIRLKFDCLCKVRDCLVIVAFCLIGITAKVIVVCIIRCEFDCFAIVRDCPLIVAFVVMNGSSGEIDNVIIGEKPYRLVKVGDCPVIVAFNLIGYTSVPVCIGIIRLERNCPSIKPYYLIVILRVKGGMGFFKKRLQFFIPLCSIAGITTKIRRTQKKI